MAAASPAHAASDPGAAMILLDQESYEWSSYEAMTITGTLVPAPGGEVPTNLRLGVSFSGGTGFTAAVPVVTGSTFSVVVTAQPGASGSKLTISSWTHPAYLPAEAQLTVAAVPVGGTIVFDAPAYDIPSGEKATITGTLVHNSGAAPAGFTLTPTFSDDTAFGVVAGPVVSGDTFELTVEAKKPGPVTGTIGLASASHPQYASASASVTALEPGFVDAEYRMVPIAAQWVRTETPNGSDPNVRWFRPKGNVPVVVPSLNTPWLDLRFHLYQSRLDYQDNFGNAPFGPATITGGFPQPWTDMDTKTVVTVKSFTFKGAAESNPAQAIGVELGGFRIYGDGPLSGRAIFGSNCGFLPDVAPNGRVFTNATPDQKAFYATAPTGLKAGNEAVVEIVTSMIRKDGAVSKIGYILAYKK